MTRYQMLQKMFPWAELTRIEERCELLTLAEVKHAYTVSKISKSSGKAILLMYLDIAKGEKRTPKPFAKWHEWH